MAPARGCIDGCIGGLLHYRVDIILSNLTFFG
jgi:hypothetical protein